MALRQQAADEGMKRIGGTQPVDLNLAEPVRWDDRLRFSNTPPRSRITRKRSIPEHQLLDIRNAISFIQGEAGRHARDVVVERV